MGCNLSFFDKLKLFKKGDAEKRVLILGLDNAGKTCILRQLKHSEFKDTIPTVGMNVEQITYRNVNITLWDVGGQARILWKHYYDGTNGVIFVVDSSDYDRVAKAAESIQSIATEEELENCPILILANKSDKKNKMSLEEISERLQLSKLNRKNVVLHECSALKADTLWEGIGKLTSYFADVLKPGEDKMTSMEKNNSLEQNPESSPDSKSERKKQRI